MSTAQLRRAEIALAGALIAVALTGVAMPAHGASRSTSGAIAITPDGTRLLVVNPDSGSLTVVSTATRTPLAELPVGAGARCVAVDGAGRFCWVTSFDDGRVSTVDLTTLQVVTTAEVGARPYGIVVTADGTRVFVALQGENRVLELDGSSLSQLGTVATAARPAGLALLEERAELLVTHLLDPQLTVLDTTTLMSTGSIALWPDSNLVQAVSVSPGGAVAYVPHTRSNEPNQLLTFDTTVFPLVSLIDVAKQQQLLGQQLTLDTLDPPGVGLPFDVAISGDGTVAWVVNAASNDVTVVDLSQRRRLAHIEVGANPRGIVLAPDGATAYVNNTLSGTVTVLDSASLTETATIQVTSIPLPPAMLRGKQLFYSSDDPRLARDQWIACTTCHYEGEHDGRTWRFRFSGPRNTTTLLGMIDTYPLRWSAEWDESADSEFAVTREQFGSGLLDGTMHDTLGLPNTGRDFDLDCLAAYIDSLEAPELPGLTDLDPDAVARGRILFEDDEVGCLECHPQPYGTDFQVHDVGTADGPSEQFGPEIDTPTLRDLERSAPYLHDGSATTLLEVLTTTNPADEHGVTSHLSSSELDDLVTYLRWLSRTGGGEPAEMAVCHRQRTEHRSNRTSRSPRDAGGRGDRPHVVSGQVVFRTTGQPVPGALVSVRAAGITTTTDRSGRFRIAADSGDQEITAWLEGYYIASTHVHPPSSGVELALRRYHTSDHDSYAWIDPTPSSSEENACGNCHPMILPQWSGNAHGQAVSNPRFYSLYNGTDITGTTTVAPGYLLDFPGTTGNCAACHAPGAAIDAPFSTDMNDVRDQVTAGIHCDFCHKTAGAYLRTRRPEARDCTPCHDAGLKHGGQPLDAAVREPYPNMPGVFSLKVLRPPPGEQLFVGPYPDIHDPDTYHPLMHDSGFCAPCHQFSFWGTPIYESYGEWLASPYSDPETGQTCQDCHMPPTGDSYFALADQGGLEHPPETIPSHLQLGATSTELLQATVDLAVNIERAAGAIDLTVTVTNSGAGHHVPTDHPGRNMLVLVTATDAGGTPLSLEDGPTLPTWSGGHAGEPGTAHAKLLRDVETGEWPVVSYWKPTLLEGDTRLAAFEADTNSYRFTAPSGTVDVHVQVVFRRLFEPIADRYGWDLGEIVMASQRTTLAP